MSNSGMGHQQYEVLRRLDSTTFQVIGYFPPQLADNYDDIGKVTTYEKYEIASMTPTSFDQIKDFIHPSQKHLILYELKKEAILKDKGSTAMTFEEAERTAKVGQYIKAVNGDFVVDVFYRKESNSNVRWFIEGRVDGLLFDAESLEELRKTSTNQYYIYQEPNEQSRVR